MPKKISNLNVVRFTVDHLPKYRPLWLKVINQSTVEADLKLAQKYNSTITLESLEKAVYILCGTHTKKLL